MDRNFADSVRYRCDIDLDKESIACNTKLSFANSIRALDSECSECPERPFEQNIYGLDIFKDNETMVYMEDRRSCLFIRRLGEERPECLTDSDYYYLGGNVVISPDERWIAFTVARKIGESHGIVRVEEDLYVVEIRKE